MCLIAVTAEQTVTWNYKCGLCAKCSTL